VHKEEDGAPSNGQMFVSRVEKDVRDIQLDRQRTVCEGGRHKLSATELAECLFRGEGDYLHSVAWKARVGVYWPMPVARRQALVNFRHSGHGSLALSPPDCGDVRARIGLGLVSAEAAEGHKVILGGEEHVIAFQQLRVA